MSEDTITIEIARDDAAMLEDEAAVAAHCTSQEDYTAMWTDILSQLHKQGVKTARWYVERRA